MKKSALLLLLLLCAPKLFGYNLRNISKNEGLTNSSVLSIAQDNKGYMLFGTCDKLNIFDGMQSRALDMSYNQQLINGHLVFSTIQLRDNRYCIQTNYGLNILDSNKNLLSFERKYKANTHLKQAQCAILYFVSESGKLVVLNKDNSFSEFDLVDIEFQDMLDYYIDNENKFWIFQYNKPPQLYSIKIEQGSIKSIAQEQQNTINIATLAAQNFDEHLLYVDCNGDLMLTSHLRNTTTKIANIKDEIDKKGRINSIAKLQENYLIGFEQAGLSVIMIDKWTGEQQYFETEINSGIFCIVPDRRQNIMWIGTDGQGVFIFSQETYSVKSLETKSFIEQVNNPIRALYLDQYKHLWIGTKGDGLLKINQYNHYRPVNRKDVERITTNNSNLSDNSVFEICKSTFRNNVAWIGTSNGIDYIDIQTNRIYNTNLPISYIYSILETSQNTLWAASVGYGIFKINITEKNGEPVFNIVKNLTLNNGEISSNYFFKIAPQNDSTLLLANRGEGCFMLDLVHEQIVAFPQTNIQDINESIDDVYSVISDGNSRQWLATGFAMAELKNTGEFKLFREGPGLLYGHSIQGIILDNEQDIWATTCNGIVRYDHKTNSAMTLDANNGLNVVEFSNGACYNDTSTGMLLFGGINGLISIVKDAEQNPEEQQKNILRLNTINIDNQWYYSEEILNHRNELTIEYDQDILTLCFALLDYRSITDYIFEYRLSQDSKWLINNGDNVLNLTNMKDGEYDIEVRVINRVNNNISEHYTLRLVVNPPWWFSRTANTLYILFIVLSVTYLIFWLLRRNKQKQLIHIKELTDSHQKEVYESKIRIFNNIAKEFTTPLTIISTPCENLLEYGIGDNVITSNMNIVMENFDRMKNLIHDFSNFKESQIPNVELIIQPVDVAYTVLSQIATFSESANEKDIKFETEAPKNLKINTDRTIFNSLINNLMNFVMRESFMNQKILVKITNSESKGVCLAIHYSARATLSQELVAFLGSFKDNNDIFAQNQELHIKNQLSILSTYSLARKLKGNVSLGYHDNLSSITICLASMELSESQSLEKNDKEADYSLKKVILIVDDSSEMLEYYRHLLEHDYNIVTLFNPLDVEDKMLELNIDLLMMSTKIIALDDFALVRRIRNNPLTIKIPILVISNKKDAKEKTRAIDAGVQMYLTKPFRDDYLVSAVRNNIDRSEELNAYLNSPISSLEVVKGKTLHKEQKRFMVQLTEIISQNIQREDLSADYIASQMNISTRQLYRKIKEVESRSIKAIIQDVRLQYAARQLRSTLLTIDEVINTSGFTSRSSFYRVFQQRYGVSPGLYRSDNSTRE